MAPLSTSLRHGNRTRLPVNTAGRISSEDMQPSGQNLFKVSKITIVERYFSDLELILSGWDREELYFTG